MANIMQNRVDAILDPKQMDIITSSIKNIVHNIPGIETLTLNPDERNSILSLDVDNKAFVEDAIMMIKNNGSGIMPVFVKPDQIQHDLTLFEQMDEIYALLQNVIQQVGDLRRIAASEALGVSNTVYGVFEIAAKAGIPGAQAAYDKLKERYKNQGGGGPKKED